MRTITAIQEQLPTSPDVGLTAEGRSRSQQLFGSNRLTPAPRQPAWKKFLAKFNEPIIKILLVAALLSLLVDLFKLWSGSATGSVFVDGLAVLVAVLLATGVAFLSEYQSDREFEALNAHKHAQQVKVQRDGALRLIPLDETLVGDVVRLEIGDEIPADGRLLSATHLHVDQALMTGEAEPVVKTVQPSETTAAGLDQPGCVYRGTQIVEGAGFMLVTEVGDATMLGQIARRLSALDDQPQDSEVGRVQRRLTMSREETPLQQKLAKLAAFLSRVGYVAAGLIFLAQLLRGLLHGDVYLPTSFGQAAQVAGVLLDYFMLMVILIVVAVPEGLPMSVTVSLALAMRKMTRAHCLVRQLVACETIGSATVICTDKTGTLTQNRMTVVQACWDGQSFGRHELAAEPFAADGEWTGERRPSAWLTLIAAVNSTAVLEDKQGKQRIVGNTTEGALLQWLAEKGVDYLALRKQFEPLFQTHFSSKLKRMTTVIRSGKCLVALVKGAPEQVLNHSTHYLTATGEAQPWTPEARAAVEQRLGEATSQAMRTLAFAYAVLPPEVAGSVEWQARPELLECNLVFVGFVAIQDPLRPEVPDALAKCRTAGIGVKMITGDNVETARAIARQAGLFDPADTPDAAILTSAQFNELSDDELKDRLPSLRVLARAQPLDKYRLVRLLQELGEVVAVTGDGTNDAPALKKADVGLAMGLTGTEVAKEASKMVLLDDSFATIVQAVKWGRSLYENIQRFLQFQLTINVSALAIAFLGPLLFGIQAPFTVLQLLWINVIMDTFASIALCSEPPREAVLQLPPKRRDENIVTPMMRRTIGIMAAFFVVTMLGLLLAMKRGWLGENRATFTIYQGTIFFTVYVFFQVWNQINCRSLTPAVSGFVGLLSNPAFLAIAALTALGQVLIVTFGGTVFKTEALGLLDWLGVLGITSSVLVFAELVRRIRLWRATGGTGMT